MFDMTNHSYAGKDAVKNACVAKFKEWWGADDLSITISKINQNILKMIVVNEKITNPDRLAEILYDIVGPHFLKNVENDKDKHNLLLYLILDAAVKGHHVSERSIVSAAKSVAKKSERDYIYTIKDIPRLSMTARMAKRLAMELGLPSQVADAEHAERLEQTEVVVPHSPLNPLYDYQYTTGLFIRRMLESKEVDSYKKKVKRKLITVPTGSGKTRMVAEAVICWLNDGKPSDDKQQRDSKFVLWVAQSSELCEQAFSMFKTVFESVGVHGTTLHMHRFWGSGGNLPDMDLDNLLDEKGVIVATIQSLYKLLDTGQLEELADITSCIVVDEAHHATASSYSEVLKKMGFNWNNTKTEISTKGIILIGLTATPFRGSGTGTDTEKLKRWFNGVYFPEIPYVPDIANFKPHALVDCQTYAYADEYVNILGERSYDRDGYIDDKDYFWRIIRWGGSDNHTQDKDEWTFEMMKNIQFRPTRTGKYEITLKVIDNEGDHDTATARLNVYEKPNSEESDMGQRQKALYEKLTKKNVLCNVYHVVLKSKKYDIAIQDVDYLRKWGEFSKNTLRAIEADVDRNMMIVDEIAGLKKIGMKKILFFGCSVDHSRIISILLQTKHNIRARYVDSKVGIDARVNIIEEFKKGDLEVLCNFNILTTGFDAPNIDCVFVGRPIRSTLLYTQIIGRGMRGTKTGGTTNMMLVDINDNFQLKSGHDIDIAHLGWKLFSDHWTYINNKTKFPGAINQTITKEPNSATSVAPDNRPVLSHTCISCGVEALGIESIERIFGIVGHASILVAILESDNRQGIPEKCLMCREGRNIDVPKPLEKKHVTESDTPDDTMPVKEQTENDTDVHLPTAEEIDREFRHIKNEIYAHVPTSRQFWELASSDVRKEMKRLYGGYHEYLASKNLSISGDYILEDNLYDEYFELYVTMNRVPDSDQLISAEELHEYGRYRMEDYEECFGSFEQFESIVVELLRSISGSIAYEVSETDLARDYEWMQDELGREPHLKEIRSMSRFGVEYYLRMYGSLSRFKQIKSMRDNGNN